MEKANNIMDNCLVYACICSKYFFEFCKRYASFYSTDNILKSFKPYCILNATPLQRT